MNTKNLKAYAPKARREFIAAVKKRAAQFGIYEDRIEEVRIEGGAAIIEGRAFTRKEGEQRKRLESKIAERTSATYQEKYDMFIREMAYTWFNRLAAIRYMELHDYFDHGFRVLSPAKSNTNNPDGLPEILSHASDVADSLALDKSHIIELQLAGDKEEELYRELLLGQCHQLAKIMPQIFKGLGFEALDDATELLLPNNLTKTDSILKGLINDIPEEDWQEIEVIGWLYQFYISEHKDTVIGKVVKSEDIPAATQLFTPNWIVKYLVQNSVGRQWLATYPDSELKGKMEYYIEPAEQSEEVIEQLKAITPTSIDPEEIKVLDPAVGSGHILVEVYEVLREIYLERGYRLREIPELILTKNIYGLDIDDRAAQLAGFALMMKAREDDRRIFQRIEDGEVSLNVFSLQSTEGLDITTIWKGLDLEGNQQIGSTGGLFDESTDVIPANAGIYKEYFELLQTLKTAFLQAKTLGSLIQIDAKHLDNFLSLQQLLLEKLANSDTQSRPEVEKILPIVNQAIVLAQKYDAVCANPPYMGGKFQNKEVKAFSTANYKNAKNDLYAAFLLRFTTACKYDGTLSFVTPYVWLYLSGYEDFRQELFGELTLTSLVQLEYNAFEAACIPVACYSLTRKNYETYVSKFIDLSNFKGAANQAPKLKSAIVDSSLDYIFTAKKLDFDAIPTRPVAYAIGSKALSWFTKTNLVKDLFDLKQGLITGDNEKFVRNWHEISVRKLSCFNLDTPKWFPYQKGGAVRRWYGNNDLVVNWENDGQEIRNFKDSKGKLRSRPQNIQYFGKEGGTWTSLTIASFSMRYVPQGHIFADKGPMIFKNGNASILHIIALYNSIVADRYLKVLAPTLDYAIGPVSSLPIVFDAQIKEVESLAEQAIAISKREWDSLERSFDFRIPYFIENNNSNIESALARNIEFFTELKDNLSAIEEKIDRIFIDTYGLEPTSEVETSYRRVKSPGLSTALLSVHLLSYFAGCALGRFSLDSVGIVYANSNNEGFRELESSGLYKSFPADDDGIIPLASEEWLFDDDATTRFKEFVKTVWGNEHLSENLEFVAESLCLNALKPKKGESAMDTIRRYFSSQFFKDHCKTYKKRPIYWLFSSGKEKAFECLVYLHRYNEGTLSRMRTEYVTPLMGKYDAQLARLSDDMVNATGSEARRIEKDIKALEKKQAELRTFDEQLKHYAEKRITLDLDDGVKENYGKFGNLLADVKNIHGKAVK